MDTAQRLLPPGPQAPELRDGVSLRAVLAVLRRRKLYLLLPAVVVTAAFVAAALLLPSRYRAQSLLAIDPVAEAAADPAAPDAGAAGRLDRVTEVLHRRSVLEPVIESFGLYPEVRERELQAMRDRIVVAAKGPSTFSLGFDDRDPERSTRVTARLTELLIASARADRSQDTGDSVELIEDQLAAMRERLAEQEAEIEAYMARWGDELPEKNSSILGLVSSSRERLHDNSATVAQLEARLAAIDRETADLERLMAGERAASDPVQARRAELERELAALRGRYTDQHPEVIRLRGELAALAAGNGAGAPARAPEPSPLRLRHLQLVGERQEVEQRLGGARAERGSILAETSRHEQRALAAPRHEIALAAMNRELEATENQYQIVLLNEGPHG